MKTQIIFISLGLSLIIFSALTLTDKTTPVASEKTFIRDTSVTASELYRLNCAGCHGLNKEGKPPTFPSLTNVKEKLSKEQIHIQIKNGKGLMPSLAHLSDNEINAITAYLFNEPNYQTTIKNYSSVDIGKNIVMSNCVSCHRLTVNDPIPPNTKTMCPMMEPAAFAGTTRRFTKKEFNNILQTGPCYMPSFDFLTVQDKNAIWTYLKTLEGKGEPERKTMGQMCPMMIGMRDMDGMDKMDIKNSSASDEPTKIKTGSVYYTCSMHPEIKQNKPGNCPKCGMNLTKVEKNKSQEKQPMKMMCPMMNGMNDMNMEQPKKKKKMGMMGGMAIGMGAMMAVMMMGTMLIISSTR